MVARDFDGAIGALTEATILNPSFAIVHMIFGSTYAHNGQGAEGLHHSALAEAMSPRDFSQSPIHATRGLCHFMNRDYAEAVTHMRRAVQLKPHFASAWRTMAASAGLAGDVETAREAVAQCRRVQPGLTEDWMRSTHPIVHAEDRERFIAGLKAAGLY
jgi:predicted Zn-dependent protease